jgi:hypothetical protein
MRGSTSNLFVDEQQATIKRKEASAATAHREQEALVTCDTPCL